jgi:hypothetical protein
MTVKDKLNKMARLVYQEMGYVVKEGFDFEASSHPTEQMCFNIACLIWDELFYDSPPLYDDYQEED